MQALRKKVSIGLPVFNGEAFLAETLDSLLGQTFTGFELIISDNASTDATQSICQRYAQNDPRIRYFRQAENLGAIPNFNLVFELSDGLYFKWAAADDLCHPSYLEKAVAILDSHPDVAWCHSRSSHIDAEGRQLEDPEALDVSYAEREAGAASARFRAVLLGNKGCLDSYGLIRSSAIRKTPLYLPYYGPEKVFIAELALLGGYREIPEILFYARILAEGSGNLQSAAEQQSFADPSRAARFAFTRLRFLIGYLAAIRRAAPTRIEAARCLFVLLSWLGQVSKWSKVFCKALHGQGVGGANVQRIQRIGRDGGSSAERGKAAA